VGVFFQNALSLVKQWGRIIN